MNIDDLESRSERTDIYMVSERREGVVGQLGVVAALGHYNQARNPEVVGHMERHVEGALVEDVLVEDVFVGCALVEGAATEQGQARSTFYYLPIVSDAHAVRVVRVVRADQLETEKLGNVQLMEIQHYDFPTSGESHFHSVYEEL